MFLTRNKAKYTHTATTSQAATTDDNKQNKLLHKIINLRQQAADKAQKRKKVMSLENIHKLSVRKKTVYNTLCTELPLKVIEAGGSRSESQSPSISLNSQSVEELSHISEMSNNIQPPSLQSLSDKTQNLVTQTQYHLSTSDYIYQTPPTEFSEVAIEDRSKIDIKSDDPSQITLTSKMTKSITIFIRNHFSNSFPEIVSNINLKDFDKKYLCFIFCQCFLLII